jgi:hypothetical protein
MVDAAGVLPQDLVAQGIPTLDHVFAVGQTGDDQSGGRLGGTAFRFGRQTPRLTIPAGDNMLVSVIS